ncbi:MAG: carboxylating nicotinate-nucleotide diphosphorylase [Campylobacterales bacterium]|nr:carboxylating nicotinate-nucleotide diphosphorylase [Campylobacterales bacterium]
MQEIEFVKAVLDEDIGRGDLFARVVAPTPAKARIVAKSDGVLAGREYVDALPRLYEVAFDWCFDDGECFKAGEDLLYLEGDNTILLSLERTILNILHHASSIATLTKQYVDAIGDFPVKLLDTRKTRPLLRNFEKYAVRCGGGINHRFGLDDSLMLKDTHLKTIKDLGAFMVEARQKIPLTSKIEIECETLEMFEEACSVGADIIMCDNMSIEEMIRAVAYRDANYPHILIEASGNITLERIKSVASTKIDAISTGATIHQANWIDLSMRMMDA